MDESSKDSQDPEGGSHHDVQQVASSQFKIEVEDAELKDHHEHSVKILDFYVEVGFVESCICDQDSRFLLRGSRFFLFLDDLITLFIKLTHESESAKTLIMIAVRPFIKKCSEYS